MLNKNNFIEIEVKPCRYPNLGKYCMTISMGKWLFTDVPDTRATYTAKKTVRYVCEITNEYGDDIRSVYKKAYGKVRRKFKKECMKVLIEG